MIVEYLVQVGADIAAFFVTLFQDWEIPTWATDTTAGVLDFLDSASGLGHWFAWEVLSTVVGGLVVVFGITIGAKLVREIAKHVPFVGGGG